MSVKWLALIALVVGASTVGAETLHIRVNSLNPDKERTSIRGECVPDANGGQMTCDFLGVDVGVKGDPAKTAKELSELRRMFGEGKRAEVMAGRNSLCQGRPELERQLDEALKNQTISEPAKLLVRKLRDRLTQACVSPSLESALGLYGAWAEIDSKTCLIGPVSHWQESFTRQSERKWVANKGPTGVCGVVTVSTLERMDDTTWRYETRRIVTNKGELCNLVDETPAAFQTWTPQLTISCDIIEFVDSLYRPFWSTWFPTPPK